MTLEQIVPHFTPTHATMMVQGRDGKSNTSGPLPIQAVYANAYGLAVAWAKSKAGRKGLKVGNIVRLLFSDGKLATVIFIDPVVMEAEPA